ncbi:MAG: molybdopterin-dependent oxidoreductase [Deltaproteobacteria bacterium]|nr:molybdopterin-dependent oxidoreductase [Deltaproteobacteria bacterium]
MRLTRRQFLETAGAAGLALSLRHLRSGASSVGAQTTVPALGKLPDYRGWEDVYRQQWVWDKVVRAAHHVVNCASSCPFNVFVKDGIVWREEQNSVMEANNPSLPDFNPRGCQKGVCTSQLMYAPQRLKYPLKRAGARGEGKWNRITWDEALTEIADKIIDISAKDGMDCVVYDSGTANAGYCAATAGESHFFNVLGSTQLDGWAAVGDMPLGVILTWGMFNVDSTTDDYLHADLILLWLGNPSYTRIPDAHFIWEARYHGSKVVSIAPDYNASTMHCDQWVNLRVATDAALGLGMVNFLIAERLFKPDFVKEQTDLPLLVRDDTGHFLRQAEVKKGGKDNIFYLWDAAKNRIAEAPGSEGLGRSTTLKLGKLDPALEGRFEVTLADGRKVAVRPVFERLKQRLQDYTPEKVAKITGVSVNVITDLARDVAKAKAVTVFGSWGMMKHHHSDLFQRAMLLLLALTGNCGRRGTGIRVGAWYMLSGLETLLAREQPKWWQKALMKAFKPTVREIIGFTRDYERKYMYMDMPAFLFLYEHGGLKDVVNNPLYHDANPGKPLAEAVQESVAKGWLPLHPKAGKTPRMYIHTRVNPLRRWPSPQVIEKTLWPKLDLIVSVNLKMSVTTAKSDIVLPGCGYYERRGIKYAQSYVPYYAVGDKAVEPLAESKSEWEIFGLLARKIAERAPAKGVSVVKDGQDKPRDLTKLYDEWSKNGKFAPEDDLNFYQGVADGSPEMGVSWEEAVEKGAVRIKEVGPFRTHTNLCSDYEPGDSIYPCQWFVEHKQPWPTLTGRQQFYIDHDWYLAAHEELPAHKEPPKMGGDFPLRLTGGHTRWSIHSIWQDHNTMMRLQRGEPYVYIGAADAAARAIHDNDRVRVFNDAGSCELLAKVSPSVQPGQVIIYHAWEPFQFKNWQGNQEPVPSAWKALHMAEYGQLHYRFLYAGPHHNPRGTAVELQKA